MARFVAITACPTGIAHTYMAAEKLEAAAQANGNWMKVETQGSIGVESALTASEIAEADGVIIAADTDVDTSRFVGKRVLITSVSTGIEKPEQLMDDVLSAPILGGEKKAVVEPSATGQDSIGKFIYKALMNGVSHMIPFVVCGGIMIALALSIGGTPTPTGLVVPADSFWQTILQVGVLSFTLMIPILSGFIAQAIADRPGLIVGMVAGFIANNGASFPYLTVTNADGSTTGLNTGFIGAIVIGFLAGFVAKGIRQIPWHPYIKPIVPILIIPIFGTAIVSLFYVYVFGKPLAAVFQGLTNFLASMSGASIVILAIIIGLMIAFDMGGPVNKVAFLFAGGMIATNPAIMGIAATAIAVPPLGVGLATLVQRKLFSDQEREAGIAALFMGFFGITEGAIPFAAEDPARVIPANMIGGAVGAVVAALLGVKNVVMHGGPIVGVLGAATPLLGYFFAILVGAVTTASIIIALKLVRARRNAKTSATPAAV